MYKRCQKQDITTEFWRSKSWAHWHKPSDYAFLASRVHTRHVRDCDCACCRRSARSLGNRYGPGTGPILLDDLQCRGSETQLGNCQSRPWGSHDCNHAEDVSIACYDEGTGCLNNLWLRSLRYYHRSIETCIITCSPQNFNEESRRNY